MCVVYICEKKKENYFIVCDIVVLICDLFVFECLLCRLILYLLKLVIV